MKTATREHPILFTPELVRAILDGRKTETRRVVKPQPEPVDAIDNLGDGESLWITADGEHKAVSCPYGAPGDVLWVRETFALHRMWDDTPPREVPTTGDVWWKANYPSDEYPDGNIQAVRGRWRPSIHMPKWASRLRLKVEEVRAEKVKEITAEEALAEGVDPGCCNCGEPALPDGCGCEDPEPLPRDAFIWLWNHINAERGFPWDENPWAWVVRFTPEATP